MIYQHPLAYLLGLEGIALLHAWAGDYDKDFVLARLGEVRRLLDDDAVAKHPGVEVTRGDTMTGYRHWSATYDEPRNTLFDLDEPVVHDILGALPAGDALDAACGTGRYARYLAARGHRVIGVDSSPDMLAAAVRAVPQAEFRRGDLHAVPLPDRFGGPRRLWPGAVARAGARTGDGTVRQSASPRRTSGDLRHASRVGAPGLGRQSTRPRR